MYAIQDESRIDIRKLELPKPNHRLDNTRDINRIINSLSEAEKVVQEFTAECARRNVSDDLVIYPERLAGLQEQIDRIFPAIARLESNPELYDQPVAIPNQLQSDVLGAIDELIFIFQYEIRINSEKLRRIPLNGDLLDGVTRLAVEADYILNEIYIKCAAKGINADEVFAPVEGDLGWLCGQYEKKYQPLIQRLEDNPRLMKKSRGYIENLSDAKDCVSRFVAILRQLWDEQGLGDFQYEPELVVLEDCDSTTQATDELINVCQGTFEPEAEQQIEISDRTMDNTANEHTTLLEDQCPHPTQNSILELLQGKDLDVSTPHSGQQQEVVPMISTDCSLPTQPNTLEVIQDRTLEVFTPCSTEPLELTIYELIRNYVAKHQPCTIEQVVKNVLRFTTINRLIENEVGTLLRQSGCTKVRRRVNGTNTFYWELFTPSTEGNVESSQDKESDCSLPTLTETEVTPPPPPETTDVTPLKKIGKRKRRRVYHVKELCVKHGITDKCQFFNKVMCREVRSWITITADEDAKAIRKQLLRYHKIYEEHKYISPTEEEIDNIAQAFGCTPDQVFEYV
ncbi:hypothetical protein NIES2100_35270 [Calothrix sp. NIES-2100]|uniref:hypothetical protein n=1 Tax=Calothrix sp. NIES-2100 TaxID=1954172 RepID=UPI000B5EF218|nr:hypothetical protein NIES2100_35270 [Calothrix sp. NIES-2100]